MSISPVRTGSLPPVAAAPLRLASPPVAGRNAGNATAAGGGLGGLLGNLSGKLREAMVYAALGAGAGMVLPFIPGGPVGGALIGAALSLLL